MNCVRINEIACYGDLQDDSNFSVVCADEEFDSVWIEGNPESNDFTFETWEEVVAVLMRFYPDIEEITAV